MAKPPRSLIYRATQLRLTLMVGQWRRSITLGALVFMILVLIFLVGMVDFLSGT